MDRPGRRGKPPWPAIASLACPFAGALAVLAFAPERIGAAAFVSVAVLLWAVDSAPSHRRALLNAFLFGLGLYIPGVGWMYISLHNYGGMGVLLAGAATLLVCAWMAGWLALGALASRLVSRRVRDGFLRLLVVAVVWSVLETHARAAVSLGFPWLVLGNSQVPSGPLAGLVPFIGAYGVSVAIAILSAAGVALARSLAGLPRRREKADGPSRPGVPEWLAPATVVAAYLLASVTVQGMSHTSPAGEPIEVSLLQGNIPQDHKWVASNRDSILSVYEGMTELAEGRLVILPETALPEAWQAMEASAVARYRARGASADGAVIVGAFELDADLRGWQNSAIALGAFEDVHYRKVRLAPFGEFIPFAFLFQWAANLLEIPYSQLVAGKGEALMDLPFGKALVTICYEDAFPGAFVALSAAAAFLVNMTNAAWFEDSRMIDQHLQISQARSLETGREMIRAANTGYTAHVGHRGRVISALDPHERGILAAEVTPRTGTTPYVRHGKLLLALAVGATFALALALRRR